MSHRFNVTPFVLAGFEKAKGDAVIYIDCDLQGPPELIPRLIEHCRDGSDIVHANRTARHGENPFKMWLTRQACRVINAPADIYIVQNTGDFKLISRRALDQIMQLREFDPVLRGFVACVGFRQSQVFDERDVRFASEV